MPMKFQRSQEDKLLGKIAHKTRCHFVFIGMDSCLPNIHHMTQNTFSI
jgi:hypothetical protein